jgi:hypothetical protein
MDEGMSAIDFTPPLPQLCDCEEFYYWLYTDKGRIYEWSRLAAPAQLAIHRPIVSNEPTTSGYIEIITNGRMK